MYHVDAIAPLNKFPSLHFRFAIHVNGTAMNAMMNVRLSKLPESISSWVRDPLLTRGFNIVYVDSANALQSGILPFGGTVNREERKICKFGSN